MVLYTTKNLLSIKDILKTLPSSGINNYIQLYSGGINNYFQRQLFRKTTVKEFGKNGIR